MIETTIHIVKLTASDGFTLTNGEAFGKEIYLGCNDSSDNWHEITDEEASRLQKQAEERGEDE